MITTAKLTCSECREHVEVPADVVRHVRTPHQDSLTFRCPACDGQSYAETTGPQRALLQTATVRTVTLRARTRFTGPAITEDEYIAVGREMERVL